MLDEKLKIEAAEILAGLNWDKALELFLCHKKNLRETVKLNPLPADAKPESRGARQEQEFYLDDPEGWMRRNKDKIINGWDEHFQNVPKHNANPYQEIKYQKERTLQYVARKRGMYAKLSQPTDWNNEKLFVELWANAEMAVKYIWEHNQPVTALSVIEANAPQSLTEATGSPITPIPAQKVYQYTQAQVALLCVYEETPIKEYNQAEIAEKYRCGPAGLYAKHWCKVSTTADRIGAYDGDGNKKRRNANKVRLLESVIPLIQRPEGKKQAETELNQLKANILKSI